MLRTAIPIEAATPLHLQRCAPTRPCPQSRACARCQSSPCSLDEHPIDGTVLRHSLGAWCPLFVDARGLAMQEAA